MTKILLKDLQNKNEIIEQFKLKYGDVLINEILNNKDTETQYFFNNILIC
jgi:hypothetical protein